MKDNKKKARVPVQERGRETRESIVSAARKLFSEKGYYRTNSKEIAREAGVATGSFYMYFDDKKPLLLEVFQSIYREIAETVFTGDILKSAQSLAPKELVHLLVTKLYEAHTIAPEFHREAMAMVYSDPDIRAINDQEDEKVISLLVSILEKNRQKLQVEDIEAAARIIHHSADEVIHSIKIFGSPVGEKRLLSELEDMIYRYIFK